MLVAVVTPYSLLNRTFRLKNVKISKNRQNTDTITKDLRTEERRRRWKNFSFRTRWFHSNHLDRFTSTQKPFFHFENVSSFLLTILTSLSSFSLKTFQLLPHYLAFHKVFPPSLPSPSIY